MKAQCNYPLLMSYVNEIHALEAGNAKVENGKLVFANDEDKAKYTEEWEKMSKLLFEITV
jgi:hypothetical protein